MTAISVVSVLALLETEVLPHVAKVQCWLQSPTSHSIHIGQAVPASGGQLPKPCLVAPLHCNAMFASPRRPEASLPAAGFTNGASQPGCVLIHA